MDPRNPEYRTFGTGGPEPRQQDISQVHTSLLPSPARHIPPDVQRQMIEEHEQQAHHWHVEAARVRLAIEKEQQTLSGMTARWGALLHLPLRTRSETAEIEQLERAIPTLAQHIAKLRQQWTACTESAHDHEDAIQRLRAELGHGTQR